MKKIILVLVILIMVGCASKDNALRGVVEHPFGFEEVYLLQGISYSFIGVKEDAMYYVAYDSLLWKVCSIRKLEPVGALSTSIPLVEYQ